MIYTVVLNSTKGTKLTTNNWSEISYGIDWSFLPQGRKYKVSFSFHSKKGTFTGDNIVEVYADFTASPTTYEANGNAQQKITNMLGLIHPELVTVSTDVMLQANSTDNAPIFINDRPNNNFFTITLRTFYETTSTKFNIGTDYIMVLSFEEYSYPKGRQYFD